jgi:hypothetical protein
VPTYEEVAGEFRQMPPEARAVKIDEAIQQVAKLLKVAATRPRDVEGEEVVGEVPEDEGIIVLNTRRSHLYQLRSKTKEEMKRRANYNKL